LKTGIVEPEETEVAGKRLVKQAPTATFNNRTFRLGILYAVLANDGLHYVVKRMYDLHCQRMSVSLCYEHLVCREKQANGTWEKHIVY
jgi:hypothetical protein